MNCTSFPRESFRKLSAHTRLLHAYCTQHRGPLLLFAAWCVALIVSFSAGAAGPPVLIKNGKGDNVVNFTNIGDNYTKVENGTLVFMHLHPGNACCELRLLL